MSVSKKQSTPWSDEPLTIDGLKSPRRKMLRQWISDNCGQLLHSHPDWCLMVACFCSDENGAATDSPCLVIIRHESAPSSSFLSENDMPAIPDLPVFYFYDRLERL